MGYLVLFLGCLLSATVIPFSSEAMVTAAILEGYNKLAVVAVASLGNAAGGMITYAMGYFARWQWIEKWFRISASQLEKAQQKIRKYGLIIAFFTWLPFVGDALALGLGVFRMQPLVTALLMFAGKLLRYIVVVYLVSIF